jgi:hypothetical protein
VKHGPADNNRKMICFVFALDKRMGFCKKLNYIIDVGYATLGRRK